MLSSPGKGVGREPVILFQDGPVLVPVLLLAMLQAVSAGCTGPSGRLGLVLLLVVSSTSATEGAEEVEPAAGPPTTTGLGLAEVCGWVHDTDTLGGVSREPDHRIGVELILINKYIFDNISVEIENLQVTTIDFINRLKD